MKARYRIPQLVLRIQVVFVWEYLGPRSTCFRLRLLRMMAPGAAWTPLVEVLADQ